MINIIQTNKNNFSIYKDDLLINLTKEELLNLRNLCCKILKDEVVCKCCGTGNLNWKQFNGKWLLFNGEELHDCPVNPLEILKEHEECHWM